ncbi:hypothetical protein GGI12_000706 [Dipsacomyces acuminosporus]|nr:hypothetical protein GGI12_000706 [Dipsacomyces acuminosporus]
MCASQIASINVSDRRSWGLGITLAKSQHATDLERDAGIIATANAGTEPTATKSLDSTAEAPDADSVPSSALTFFQKLAKGVAYFMSTATDEDVPSQETDKSKSRIEDMLETYYLSQGHKVPEWVYNPPPDPPMNGESHVAASNAPAISLADRQSRRHEKSREEPGSTPATKEGSHKANASSSIHRPLRRFNTSKPTRQPPWAGPSGVLDRTNRDTPAVSQSWLQAQALSSPRSMHDSGFTSPQISDPLRTGGSASVQNQADAVERLHPRSIPSTPLAASDFELDSEQLALGASEHASPKHSSARETPNVIKRSHTTGSYTRRSDRAGREKSPIALTSILPQSLKNKLHSSASTGRSHTPSISSPLAQIDANGTRPAAASGLNTASEANAPLSDKGSPDARRNSNSIPRKLRHTVKLARLFRRKKHKDHDQADS